MDNLFHSFSSGKYIESTLNLIRNIKNIILDTINQAIDTIDSLFFYSSYRKSISMSTNKIKDVGFFPIDELFDFEKYKTYDKVIRGLLINEADNTNTIKDYNNSLVYNFDILKNLTHSSLPDITR